MEKPISSAGTTVLTFSLLSLLITTMANKRYISFLDGLHGKILCMWEQSFDHACWSLLVFIT
jgi:hypothetical protein